MSDDNPFDGAPWWVPVGFLIVCVVIVVALSVHAQKQDDACVARGGVPYRNGVTSGCAFPGQPGHTP